MDIEQLLAQKKPSVGNVKFIAIDGHGGSGKSTLGKLLAKRLKAEIIQTDDFASCTTIACPRILHTTIGSERKSLLN